MDSNKIIVIVIIIIIIMSLILSVGDIKNGIDESSEIMEDENGRE